MGRLVGPRGVIVCAVSGGADSMALVHGLHRVRELRRRDWTLHVAHLDHCVPANAADMMTFVRAQAAALGLPFHAAREDVPALSRATGESIEEAGRKARYAYLERVCRDVNAAALAMAHQADDQAETILHRVLRGTGLRGLAGIPESRVLSAGLNTRLIRPLLRVRRADCEAYLDRRGLRFMHDVTNDDPLAATRNRIRRDLLPLIQRDFNPQAPTALARLGELAQQAVVLIDALAETAFARCCVERGATEVCFDRELLAKEHEAIRAAVIGLAVDRLGGPRGETGHERLTAAERIVSGERDDRLIELPGGVRVARRGRFVVVSWVGMTGESDCADPETGHTSICAPTISHRDIADGKGVAQR